MHCDPQKKHEVLCNDFLFLFFFVFNRRKIALQGCVSFFVQPYVYICPSLLSLPPTPLPRPTIDRTYKQPRYPATDEWIKKLWYIYAMEYCTVIKRDELESAELK